MTRSTKSDRIYAIPLRNLPHAGSEVPFGSVGRQMNKMLEQVNKGYFSYHPAETWTPAVNLYEKSDSYLVCVDLAGVDKGKIDITVAGQRLTLRGTRQVPVQPGPENEMADVAADPNQQPRMRVHLMEVDHGAFSRDVELPEDVESDQITATYRNGLLWIELPRK